MCSFSKKFGKEVFLMDMNNMHYFIEQAQIPSNEQQVAVIYGQHVNPTFNAVENPSWVKTLGASTFCYWLGLLSMSKVTTDENYLDSAKSLKEIMGIFDISQSTFTNKLIRPLYEYGLIDVVDIPGSEKYNRRGLPSRKIIVYPYPQGRVELLTQPLTACRNYDLHYQSKAKEFGLMGAHVKKKIQFDEELMQAFDNKSLHNSPVDNNAVKNNSFELEATKNNSNTYPQAIKNNSFDDSIAIKNNSNCSDAVSEDFGDSKLLKKEAFNIYSNNSSLNNSNLISLEEEEEDINKVLYIYPRAREEVAATSLEVSEPMTLTDTLKSYQTVVSKFAKQQSEFERDFVYFLELDLLSAKFPFDSVQEIKNQIISVTKMVVGMDDYLSYQQLCLEAANKQIDFMVSKLKIGETIFDYAKYFIGGYKSNLEGFVMVQKQESQFRAMNDISSSNPVSVTDQQGSVKPPFYNWLKEQD